jgi:alpha-glucuronidase
MDRTVATGTGYIGQYPPPLAAKYESLATCPDELLLFMHHVPYTHQLHSGKTVIQHIYDSHFWGAQAAAAQVPAWESLHGKVSDAIYYETLKRLKFQAGHAVVWRDAVTRWFNRMSGIPDADGRVGRYPGRIEAESMTLRGYAPVAVTPWETASGDGATICGEAECSAERTWEGPDGWYDVTVQYFDLPDGRSRFSLSIGSHDVAGWVADDTLPSDKLNGHTSTRHVIRGVAIHRGDVVQVTGHPDGPEKAPLDYIEIREHQPDVQRSQDAR